MSIKDKENVALANGYGEICDAEYRKIIYDNFKEQFLEFEEDMVNYNIELAKSDLEIAIMKKKIINSKTKEKVIELKKFFDKLVKENKEIELKFKNARKCKDSILLKTEKILGYKLNNFRGLFRILK